MSLSTYRRISSYTVCELACVNDVRSDVTSIICHPRIYHIAKLYLSYAIFVTYALVLYVPLDFMEPPLFRYMKINQKKQPKRAFLFQAVFRSVLVLITGEVTLPCNVASYPLYDSWIGSSYSRTTSLHLPHRGICQ